MPPRGDDHEETRREHAAEIASLKANVERIDETAAREHEVIEVLRERSHAQGNMFGELQLAQANHSGRIERLEDDGRKGSDRMARIEARIDEKVEPRITAIEHTQIRMMGWVSGSAAVASLAAGLIGKLLGW